jgi:uncharacterized RDD family membrane protein YckC
MFCKYCGKEIPENSKFCRYCGKSLDSTSRKEHPEVLSDSLSETSENVQYAGFWVRLGAYLADMSGLFLISILMGIVLYTFLDETTADSLIDNTPDFIYGYIAYAIYSTISLSIFSTTFGKYLYGLRIVNDRGENLDFNESLKRSLLQPFSTFLFGIGYWSMNKNEKKQAWHDIKAETAVVQKNKSLIFAYIATFIAIIAWFYFTYSAEY